VVWAWLERRRVSGAAPEAPAIAAYVKRWAEEFAAEEWPRRLAGRYREMAERYVETDDTFMAHACYEVAVALEPEDRITARNRHLTMAALLSRSRNAGDLAAALDEARKALTIDPSRHVQALIERLESLHPAATPGPARHRPSD